MRHIPCPPKSSPALTRYLFPFNNLPQPCREAEIAAGVGAAWIVEGDSVELVVVLVLEVAEVAVVVLYLENRPGMSYPLSSDPNSCLVSIFAEGQPANIDARLANSAEDRLIVSFKSLSLRQDAMPPRPNYGTKG